MNDRPWLRAWRIPALAVLIVSGLPVPAQEHSVNGIRGALDSGFLGLYDAASFRLADGRCADCPTPKPALWYFEGDVIAVPREATTHPLVDSGLSIADDIRRWQAAAPDETPNAPFLAWLGAPELAQGARLRPDGTAVTLADGGEAGFAVVPKIPSNQSYYDASTVRYFSGRSLRLRGRTEAGPGGQVRFVARVIWPEDFRIDVGALRPEPLGADESLADLIQADGGGAKSAFATRLLWERSPSPHRDGGRRAVLAFMLNGAQGDDDEAHGGHFAVVTGWHRRDGQWADWMVNNFYNLDSVSEKGIIASMLPMDNYLMDLNSGQSYYRPSYMLAAVLRDQTSASLTQRALERVYDRFYRHHIEYDHARANCAGISLDALAGLGWDTTKLGPTSYAKAALGYFYSSFNDRSFTSGRRTFRYMLEERSRLYPRAAFEVLGRGLLTLAASPGRARTAYERMLADDVEAIVFARVPQIPSSRAFGTFPVASFDEYVTRVPKDRRDWKIIPVDARPFPDALRDRPPDRALLSDNVTGTLATGGLAMAVSAPVAWWLRRRRASRLAGRPSPSAPTRRPRPPV